MKIKIIQKICAFVLFTFLSLPLSTFAQGTAFTYQGRLNSGTNAATGLYDLTFSLYNAGTGGSQIGNTVTNAGVGVTNGLFTVPLDFGGVYNGTAYWLQISVRTNGAASYTPLTARQPLTPTPYAITAQNLTGTIAGTQLTGTVPSGLLSGIYGGILTLNNAGDSFSGSGAGLANVNALSLNGLNATNFWKTTGNAGTTAGVNYLGTPDNQALEIHVNGARGFRVEPDPIYSTPNVIGGSAANYVGAGWVGNFIGAGGQAGYASNSITGGNLNVIGGGWSNQSTNGYENVIAGGQNNTVAGGSASIGGGNNNVIQNNATGAVIGGGQNNTVQTGTSYSTIGGGGGNTVGDDGVGTKSTYSFIGGGQNNSIMSPDAFPNPIGAGFIGGGVQNGITESSYAVIGGGTSNGLFQSDYSVIGGGIGNGMVEANLNFIGGGQNNHIGANAGGNSIVGGSGNLVFQGGGSFIGGGSGNSVYFGNSTISGGTGNAVQSTGVGPNFGGGAIGGGAGNIVYGANATVPGGLNNQANGDNSFAAGQYALAQHAGAFVWADSSITNAFVTTASNQFLIRAVGGVGIGTTNPAAALDVRGDIKLGPLDQYFAPAGAEKLRIVRGIIQPNGTSYNGTGFTVSHLGTGSYSITFNPAFTDAPALIITPYSATSPVVANCNSGSGSGYSTILTWVGSSQADTWWNFVAIGGR